MVEFDECGYNMMRIAYVQMDVRFGDKEANLAKVEALLEPAMADLFVLPELCTTGYLFASREQAGEMAESLADGMACNRFSAVARKKNCFLVFGMAEKADGKIFNSAVLIGPRGYLAVYRKIHLYDEEKLWFDPGDRPFAVHDIGLARLGMMICFDWIFPESMRSLALQDAEIICHPANLVLPYCQSAMVTRCLENNVYAITANRIGAEKQGERRLRFTGASQIIGPRGEILHRGPKKGETVGMIEVDPKRAREKWLTGRNHLVQDRRPDLYFSEKS